MKGIVFSLCVFFGLHHGSTQRYSPDIEIKVENFGNREIKTFSTEFDVPEKEVRRGFWKYCKSFARLNNLKEYYEVIIPSTENEGNVDLNLLAKIYSEDHTTFLLLGPAMYDVPESVRNTYFSQSRKLLLDFKRRFYISVIQTEIDDLTKKSKKLSGRYERMKKKGGIPESEQKILLDSVSKIHIEIGKLQSTLFEISKTDN